MNQQELIGKICKISLVLLIFSTNGQEWFLKTYIKLFIIGSLQLSYQIQNMIYTVLDYNPNGNNYDVFNLFSISTVWQFIAQQSFSKRMIALAISSTGGFVMALIIIISLFQFIVVILKAMLYYISAIITHCVLLLISPFFFLLNLFKTTEDMFNNWTKQVMVFTIAPIAVSITITLFMLLINSVIDAIFGFNYCLGCLWYINLAFINQCIIPTYNILNLMFIPTDTSTSFILPTGLLASVLSFLVVVYTSRYAIELGSGMISRMIAFNPAFGQGSMGSIAQSAVAGIGESILPKRIQQLSKMSLFEPLNSYDEYKKYKQATQANKANKANKAYRAGADKIYKDLKALDKIPTISDAKPDDNNPGNPPGGGGNAGGAGNGGNNQ
jgi:type IV secretory pathway VirB6-like protein